MVRMVKEYLQAHDLQDVVDFRGGHCFGTCHIGPVIEINGVLHEKLNEQMLLKLLDETFNPRNL